MSEIKADDIIKLMEDFNHEQTHRAAVEIANLRLELCLLRAPSTSIGAITEESMRQYAEARGWSWEAMNEVG
jgi:hypothetical protein